MTIGIFVDTFPPDINGVATASNNLFRVLTSMGHEVYVVTTNFAGENDVSFEDHIIRIPGIVMKKLYSYRMAGVFSKKAYAILKEIKFDVFHIQTEAGIGTFGRIVASMLGIPTVYTYHTMYTDYSFYLNQYFPLPKKAAVSIMSTYSKYWANSPDEFVTTSLKTMKALSGFGVKRYINIVSNGFDFSLLEERGNDKAAIDEIRKRYSLDGFVSMCVVGRIGKEKGMDFLLDCLAALIEKNGPRYKLLIVGDGGFKADLIKKAESLGIKDNVVFVGAVDHSDVALYYSATDITLSGSLTETQGLTVAEAMCLKSMVLVREDLNFKPLIENGRTGFFFNNRDTFIEKVELIEGMDEGQRRSIAEAGYQRNAELNSLESFGRKMVYVYEKARRRNW